MLSRTGIMTALVRMVSYVMVIGISKMVAYSRKCITNNVYLSLYTSTVMMHDFKNIDLAFGILLLSCIQAEIYVISYTLPVTG